MLVIGLDLSLTGTGICKTNGEGIDLDTIGSKKVSPPGQKDTWLQRGKRLRILGIEIMQECGIAIGVRPDLIAIEAPSYASEGGMAHDRSGLWWAVTNRLMGLGIPVVMIEPTKRAMYATGNGRAGKPAVLSAMNRAFPELDIDTFDEADALVLACMAARWLGNPIDGELSAKKLSAMGSPEWPI